MKDETGRGIGGGGGRNGPAVRLSASPVRGAGLMVQHEYGLTARSLLRDIMSAERRAPSAERRAPSAERRAPSAERRAPSAERVPVSAGRAADAVGRAGCARRERHSRRLISGGRRPAAASPFHSRRVPSSPGARRGRGPAALRFAALRFAALRFAALAFAAAALALSGTAPAAADGAPRLLTGLSAKAGPAGVRLAWTVDESRAGRIAGFACVYRTPGHLKTGAPGSVACGPAPSPAGARSLTVGGLAGFPAAGAFRGDWLAALHGPGGAEAAGRLRLWTPLPAGADPAGGWPRQAVLAAGFGAMRGMGRRTAP